MSMVRELRPGDPQVIGPYRLRGQLGAGGMGRVFLGVSADGQLVAVKVVRDDLASDPGFRARFRQEVAIARKVSGPFTAPVVDADTDGPVPWLATAYVVGPCLDDAVAERGPLPIWSVLRLAEGLAEGLSAIHAAGVVHRDLKPSNVLLAKDGPRVIDFGISWAPGASTLTQSGLLVGSPGFISPEQAEGGEVGPAADVFSLGAVLAFAATGEGPFGTGSTLALVYRVIHCPPDLDRVPAELRALVRLCLAKDPAARPTARELLAETDAARSLSRSSPEPATRALIRRPPVTPEAGTAPVPVPVSVLSSAPLPPPVSMSALDLTARRAKCHRRRPGWRPLVAAALVAGLVGAAAAGIALTSGQRPSHAAQSEGHAASVQTTSPVTFAPPPTPTYGGY
jgi:eukaryotic-like serine/threonine-protein kinase